MLAHDAHDGHVEPIGMVQAVAMMEALGMLEAVGIVKAVGIVELGLGLLGIVALEQGHIVVVEVEVLQTNR